MPAIIKPTVMTTVGFMSFLRYTGLFRRRFDDLKRFGELILRNRQRVKETNNVAILTAGQQQQSLLKGFLLHALCGGSVGFPCRWITEFSSNHRT